MKYTKDNPKLVKDIFNFKKINTFTGVVINERKDIVYYLNGKLHREDGPAIEFANGNKEWFLNGEYHRENGPAVEHINGIEKWYLNGKYHREDGPAIISKTWHKSWYLNGKRHREDGPAVEYISGNKEWRLNDKCYGVGDGYTNESWIRFVKLELLK